MADAGRAFDVTIRQAVHPITSDVLSAAFRNAGDIERVMVNNPDTSGGETTVSAHIVFRDAGAGAKAMASLQGRAIYPNSCYVDLKPAASGGGMGGGMHHHHHQHHGGMMHHHHGGGMMHHQHHQQHHGGMMHHHHGGGMGGGHHQHHGGMMHHHHHGGGMMHHQHHQHHAHHSHHHHHSFRGGMMMGGPMRGRGFGDPRGGMMPRGGRGMGMGMMGGGDPSMMMGGGMMGGVPGGAGEPTYLVVNGVPTNVPLMKLYTLLEVYGVVFGIRRQLKSPETVVAKFEQYADAMVAAKLLSGAPFYGLELQLRHFASFADRTGFAPASGQPNDPEAADCVTFDFQHTRHRGRPYGHGGVPGKKFPPAENLFVGNLTPEIETEEVVAAFKEKGFEIKDMARKSPQHIIMTMNSVSAAVEALIAMHAHVMKERFLRVTFSGFGPHSVPPGVREAEAS